MIDFSNKIDAQILIPPTVRASLFTEQAAWQTFASDAVYIVESASLAAVSHAADL